MTESEISENLLREDDRLATFLKSLEIISDPVQKVKEIIAFMKEVLFLTPPDFTNFWEARKICLTAFKDLINSPMRSSFWEEYIELTREGRRLKTFLDEETAFAVEQIELAISSLEKDVGEFEKGEKDLNKISPNEFFSCKTLKNNEEFYFKNTKELALLNAYALQIHALRKELIAQKMRLRHKNTLFKRLSEAGDKVFPLRRERIKEVSDCFVADVEVFISEFFSPHKFSVERLKTKVFFLREEIKSLQGMAKILSLNTQAFASTREKLSGCWDQLKGLEKEFKKELAQHRETSKINSALVQEKIHSFAEDFAKDPAPPEAMKRLDEIVLFMRKIELTREDVASLKSELETLRAPYVEKEKLEEEKRQKEVQERQRERKELFASLRNTVKELKDNVSDLSIDQLETKWATVYQQKETINFLKEEKTSLEKQLKEVKELISEKKDRILISALSQEDLSALGQLKEVLNEKRVLRLEIEKQIKEIRKSINESGLDFSKAIALSEQMEQETTRLDKIKESIREIEEKLKSDPRKL